jgi:ribosomal protein L24E
MNVERSLVVTLGFKVCDFSTSVSKTGSGDLYMRKGEQNFLF